MADLHQKAVDQRNLIQRIAAKIPGFSGYQEKEQRREVDKLQREFCATKLSDQKQKVKRALDDVISSGDIDGITPFEKLMNRIDTITAKIRYADRGYSGIFDTVKVGEEQLAQVYQFDLSLAEGCEEVAHKVAQLGSGDKAARLAAVREAIEVVDKLEQFFAKREELLRKG